MLARKGCGHASEMIVDASGASSEEEGNLVFGQYMPIRGRSKRSRKEEEEEEEEDEEEEEEEEEEREEEEEEGGGGGGR